MKYLASAIVLSLLDSHALAAGDANTLRPLKGGDKLTRALQKYVQDTPDAKPTLDEKISSSTYSVESEAGNERILRSKSGSAEVYGKDLALIATINKDGERKEIEADKVKHWMPKTELAPGMKWSFSERHEQVASNSTKMCQWFGEYDAVSSAAEHDQKINGKVVRLPVIVIEVRGQTFIRNCNGTGSERQERYVYSKDLDLVLEHSEIIRSSFGALLSSSRQQTIASISLTQ